MLPLSELLDFIYARAKAFTRPTFVEPLDAASPTWNYLQESDLSTFIDQFAGKFEAAINSPPPKRQKLGSKAVLSEILVETDALPKSFRVLDIGGGVNPFRLDLKEFGVELEVDVLEQDSILGELTKRNFETNNQKFRVIGREELASQQTYQFVYLGTSLQYLPDWCELLDSIPPKFRHVTLTDTPVALTKEFEAAQQNLGRHAFRMKFEAKKKVEQFLLARGFELQEAVSHGRQIHRHSSRKDWEFWSAWFRR